MLVTVSHPEQCALPILLVEPVQWVEGPTVIVRWHYTSTVGRLVREQLSNLQGA